MKFSSRNLPKACDINADISVGYIPEQRLLAALLQNVYQDIKCSCSDPTDVKDALRWLNSADSAEVPFSFRYVCSHLDYDSIVLRRLILKTVEKNRWESSRPEPTESLIEIGL